MLTINEFPTPTPSSLLEFITAGPDGNVWFTEIPDKIGRVTPQGLITEFPIPTLNAVPAGITLGPDDNLWFTERLANKIGRIMPDGTHVEEFDVPTPDSLPDQITSGPDGNLWFGEDRAGKIGRLDPTTGAITEFQLNLGILGNSLSLTFGPDHRLWFTEFEYNMIGRMTLDGQVTTIPIPSPSTGGLGITVGPDGDIWFTESQANQIGRIDPNNFGVQEFTVPTPNSYPDQITTGLDGAVWFTEESANKIGRISDDGSVEEFAIPSRESYPQSITAGPDGNIWFTELLASNIGEYVLPATHFLVTAASSSIEGTPFDVTVTAVNAANQVVTGYTGTVHFTTSDSQATLASDYTFTTSDNGVHTFENGATLFTLGSQAITVSDTSSSSITGSATITVAPSAVAFLVSAPDSASAGSSFDVVVTALDAQGQIAKDYTGTVHFSSTDPYPGVLPSDYTFTSADSGVHTFSEDATFYTAGTQTLTAQDTVTSSITGTATINVAALSANHFAVTAPSTAVAGTSFDVTVTALDPYGNVDTGYAGTVIVLSSDRFPKPSFYTFTSVDNGTHNISVSLTTAGVHSLEARDASNGSLTGTTSVVIQAAEIDGFFMTAPQSSKSGTSFTVILTALDFYNNTVTNYSGTVHFTASDHDPGVVLPADYTFTTGGGGDNGVHAFPFGVTLITTGGQLLTASDTMSARTAGSAEIIVGSGAPPGRASNPSNPSINVTSLQEQAALLCSWQNDQESHKPTPGRR